MVHKATSSKSLSLVARVILTMIGISVLILYITAHHLEPDPRGFGTHEQLGLTPCSFYQWTGRVCPCCGATTAWAYAMRGNFTEAMSVNLTAALLCLTTVAILPWILLSACFGRWLWWQPRAWDVLTIGSTLLVIALLDWLRRILS